MPPKALGRPVSPVAQPPARTDHPGHAQPMVPSAPHPGFAFASLSQTRAEIQHQALVHAQYHSADVDRALHLLAVASQPFFDLGSLSYHAWGDLAAMVGGQLGAVLLKPVKRDQLHVEVRQRFARDLGAAFWALHRQVADWAPGLTAYLEDVAHGCAYLPDRSDPNSLLYERYTLIPLLRAFCGGGLLGLREAACWMSARPNVGKKSELENLYRPVARRDFAAQVDAFEQEPSLRVRRQWDPLVTYAASLARDGFLAPSPMAQPAASHPALSLVPCPPALDARAHDAWPQSAPYNENGFMLAQSPMGYLGHGPSAG